MVLRMNARSSAASGSSAMCVCQCSAKNRSTPTGDSRRRMSSLSVMAFWRPRGGHRAGSHGYCTSYSRYCTPLVVEADAHADFTAQQVVCRDREEGTAVRLDAAGIARHQRRGYVLEIIDGAVQLQSRRQVIGTAQIYISCGVDIEHVVGDRVASRCSRHVAGVPGVVEDGAAKPAYLGREGIWPGLVGRRD